MLSYFGGSDAVDDRVETAGNKQVHDAGEDSSGSWEIVSGSIRYRNCKHEGQTDDHDDDVSDAGVKSFAPRFT